MASDCCCPEPEALAQIDSLKLLPVGGDPNPSPGGNTPGPLDPNGILRGRDAPLRSGGWGHDIIRIGASIRWRCVWPAVDQLEQRIPDRIGRPPSAFSISASRKDAGCCDPTKNGGCFSHDRMARAAAPATKTIPQNPGFRKRSLGSFFRVGRVVELARGTRGW
jgi:hypothetical protein